MFSSIKNSKWAAAPLTAIVIMALWGNALAAVFCPHMSGGKCCFTLQPHIHSEGGSRDDSAAEPVPEHHGQMCDMESEDSPMDMAHAHDAVPESAIDFQPIIVTDAARVYSNVEAVTQANDPCSHCMMHSRAVDRFPTSLVAGIGADTSVLTNTGATSLGSLSAVHAPVELRDHSPPGSRTPLYGLVGSFRI